MIRAFRQHRFFWEKADRLVYDNLSASITQQLVNQWLSIRLDVLGTAVTALAGFLVVSKTAMSPGLAGLCLSYALQCTVFLKYGTQMASQAGVWG